MLIEHYVVSPVSNYIYKISRYRDLNGLVEFQDEHTVTYINDHWESTDPTYQRFKNEMKCPRIQVVKKYINESLTGLHTFRYERGWK